MARTPGQAARRDPDWEGVRLHVVSGKGGTGKTTLAAALALALAADGGRVLLIEVEGRQGIAELFGIAALPYEERRIASVSRSQLGLPAGEVPAGGARGGDVHVLPATVRAGRPLPVGALICFESAFPDMARTAARDGARVLVYQSSTSPFQHTWAPEQHVSLAAIRAAETGRPAVQASLTGVSAAFDAQGRELARLGTDGTGALTVRLPLAAPGTLTWYDRIGDVVPMGALLVTAGAAVSAWRSRTAAGRATAGPGPRAAA